MNYIFFLFFFFLNIFPLHAMFLELDFINESSYKFQISKVKLRKGKIVKQEDQDEKFTDILDKRNILKIYVQHEEDDFPPLVKEDVNPSEWSYFFGQRSRRLVLEYLEKKLHFIRKDAENFITFSYNVDSLLTPSEKISFGWYGFEEPSFNKEYYESDRSNYQFRYSPFHEYTEFYKKYFECDIMQSPFNSYFDLNGKEEKTYYKVSIFIKDKELPNLSNNKI